MPKRSGAIRRHHPRKAGEGESGQAARRHFETQPVEQVRQDNHGYRAGRYSAEYRGVQFQRPDYPNHALEYSDIEEQEYAPGSPERFQQSSVLAGRPRNRGRREVAVFGDSAGKVKVVYGRKQSADDTFAESPHSLHVEDKATFADGPFARGVRLRKAKDLFRKYSDGEPVPGYLFHGPDPDKLYHAHRDSFFSSIDGFEQESLLAYQKRLDARKEKHWGNFIMGPPLVVEPDEPDAPFKSYDITHKAAVAAQNTVRKKQDQLRRVEKWNNHLYLLERRNVLEKLTLAEQEMLIAWWQKTFVGHPSLTKAKPNPPRRRIRKRSKLRKYFGRIGGLFRHKEVKQSVQKPDYGYQMYGSNMSRSGDPQAWANRHIYKRKRDGRGSGSSLEGAPVRY